MSHTQPHSVTVTDAGRVVAEAVVRTDEQHGVVNATLHVEPGHLPPGTRARLVDAMLEQTEAQPGTPLEVAFPAGDAEILDRMRQHCGEVETRAAGSTVLLHGSVPKL